MPNEDIDVSNLDALEKYQSFTPYFRLAEKENRKPHWWKTYHQHTNPPPGTLGELLKGWGAALGVMGLSNQPWEVLWDKVLCPAVLCTRQVPPGKGVAVFQERGWPGPA
ncbi:hypothetical protein WISP_01124 [Willisornis vidua]|uniref:Uncharacterized protein n=1 Tax=Willisornis vidua TaxID=1566151 RepID=A0ABQ9E0K7_9PASS|nr:hypothetical protein WISP_01124 [Willisornis vidua]